jgi:hypothetical protein
MDVAPSPIAPVRMTSVSESLRPSQWSAYSLFLPMFHSGSMSELPIVESFAGSRPSW